MRVAVFSDIHGNLPALEAVLQDAQGRADRLVCAGDLAWGGPWPAEVIARVRELGCPCVVGNTDLSLLEAGPNHPYARWARPRLGPEDLEYLQSLPLRHRIDPPEHRASGTARHEPSAAVLVVHSTPDDPARPLPDPSQEAGLGRCFGSVDAAVVVHGHDHRPSMVRLSRLTVVGAGSVGQPLDGDPRACYVLLTWDGARRSWQIAHRRVPYDVEEAARLARASQMPGAERWAQAIRRGLPPDRVTL